MSQKGRIITLVVEIQDEYPQWIMDAHLHGPKNGISVKKIAEGDSIKELAELQEQVEDRAYDHFGEDL